MLSYELAKKLKDAGFPNELFYVCNSCFFQEHEGGHVENEPTLEEFIEVCSEYDLFYLKKDGKLWFASAAKDTGRAMFNTKEALIYGGEGATPSEAVAKLWLALNT